MKIGGQKISGLHEEILVLPRGPEDVIVFRAQAVQDFDEFEKLCPEPKPPGKRTKDGFVPNPDDVTYRSLLQSHGEKRIAYLVLCSLEPSKIEWDTVDISNPKTWMNYVKDFKSAGFSTIEINRIIGAAMAANALDEAKLQQAREVFLRGRVQEASMSSGQVAEQGSSPSGAPVSD